MTIKPVGLGSFFDAPSFLLTRLPTKGPGAGILGFDPDERGLCDAVNIINRRISSAHAQAALVHRMKLVLLRPDTLLTLPELRSLKDTLRQRISFRGKLDVLDITFDAPRVRAFSSQASLGLELACQKAHISLQVRGVEDASTRYPMSFSFPFRVFHPGEMADLLEGYIPLSEQWELNRLGFSGFLPTIKTGNISRGATPSSTPYRRTLEAAEGLKNTLNSICWDGNQGVLHHLAAQVLGPMLFGMFGSVPGDVHHRMWIGAVMRRNDLVAKGSAQMAYEVGLQVVLSSSSCHLLDGTIQPGVPVIYTIWDESTIATFLSKCEISPSSYIRLKGFNFFSFWE